MREWRYSSTVLHFGPRWRLVDSLMYWPIKPREIFHCILSMGGLVGPPKPVWTLWRREKPYLGRSTRSPFALM
jgi:hypothetical protein